MARKKAQSKTIRQDGFTAARRNSSADVAGWCDLEDAKSRAKGTDGTGAPGTGPVVLFGPDDRFVGTFDQEMVTVVRFAAIGSDDKAGQLTRAKLDFEAMRVRTGGSRSPLVLYAIDRNGAAWSIDFRPRGDRDRVGGIAKGPRCQRIAPGHDVPFRDIVVLRRKVVLQEERSADGYGLHSVDRRSGVVKSLGTLDLDPDLDAFDGRHDDLLLGRRHGELRLVAFGDASADGMVEVHGFEEPRVTAACLSDRSHLVVARKGGLVDRVDLHAAVPQAAARKVDPLARFCLILHKLLKRCGCQCACQGAPDEDGQRPGDGGLPEDDEPCGQRDSARIGFTPFRMHGVGTHIVAVARSGTRMAVLDRRLNVLFERKLDRAGAHVRPGQRHTQNLVVHQPRRDQVEGWSLADYVAGIDSRLGDDLVKIIPEPMPPVAYWGQKHQQAAVNPTLKVCVFPVIEPGQAYGDPDMGKLMAQATAKIYGKVDDYYDENSFGEMEIDFTTFGHDLGGMRKPLVLPRAMSSYWWDSFRPGGLKAVMPADWTNPVRFDGTEDLETQANPRAGAIKTYNIPFAAMWSDAGLGAFPVSVDFIGSENLELTIETQEGDNHVLAVNFPAGNFTANNENDVAGFLQDIGVHITDAIRAAEAALPGGPQLIQAVEFRRIRTSSDDAQFGRLQGWFKIEPAAPADMTQKGRISVTGPAAPAQALVDVGLTPAAHRPGVMDSATAVNKYFRECLRAARADAGEGPGGQTAYFSTTPSTDEDPVAMEITVGFSLTNDTGGQMATMEVLAATGLGGTGWDMATPDPGSASGPNNTNTLRDAIDLADDTFTAALDHIRATMAWDRATVEAMFADFDVMMIAHVGAPHPLITVGDQWNADDPVDFGPKRMYKRTYYATDKSPPAGEDPVQMGTRDITGQRFNNFSGPDLNNQAGVMAHELGHAIGLPDLYAANGYRDDVEYVSPWAMMGGGNSKFHHFCGWSKWKLGWVTDDPDPDINRTIFVDMPDAADVSVTEAWLVPIEYWDDAIRDDVRAEVGGSVPIGQLMKLNLGSDGGVTAFLELRASGATFSQNLAPQPTVIATNGLDPDSDRHWAVNGLYRRSVHLLNQGTELMNINDTWDFATAPEFPVKGCVAEVADIRTIRGSIPVYRVRVEREQAEFIDLHFQDHVPSWKSPDIWIDWAGDNPDPDVPRTYPVGTPTDQGETVRYPDAGQEKHFVVARVHNAGNVKAEDVKVRWFRCDPPGAGDDGRWVQAGTKTIAEVAPGGNTIVPFDWQIDSSINAHQCLRMEIIDWSIPAQVDPATGDTVALASDDVKLQNNNAQQNVFDFEALAGSPYDKIEFLMQVHNDRTSTEVAALVPEGLPYGSKLTISPRERTIPSGEARVFNCTLELDDKVIRPGCDNDRGFLLSAWRRGGEADERWGSCFYHVRPRLKTALELTQGSWFSGRLSLHGRLQAVSEDPVDLSEDMPLFVRLRILVDDRQGTASWRTVQVHPDGSFQLDTELEKGKQMVVQAWFDRTDRLGSSVSQLLQLKHDYLY